VWCAHHVSLAALIALPTWQLSGIAKWKFISLSLLFFSSPRDQSWHCIPLNYSGVDDADIYVMMTQDGATYTVASFAMNCPKIIMPTINVCHAVVYYYCAWYVFLRDRRYIMHFIVIVSEASCWVAENFIRRLVLIMDHGRPMKPFFAICMPNFWALGWTNWEDKFWDIWGISCQSISNHFGTLNPLSMFFINRPLFLQK
jgi:hypothetical protein